MGALKLSAIGDSTKGIPYPLCADTGDCAEGEKLGSEVLIFKAVEDEPGIACFPSVKALSFFLKDKFFKFEPRGGTGIEELAALCVILTLVGLPDGLLNSIGSIFTVRRIACLGADAGTTR